MQVDPKAVFDNAERFSEAAQELSRHFKEKDRREFLIPIQVNAALVLELYIKCLLTIRKCVVPHKHNLRFLFDTLPENDKASVIRHYKAMTKDSEELKAFSIKYPQFKNDLLSVLQDGGDIFDVFRYFHEGLPRFMRGELWYPTLAVRQTILDLHADWKLTVPY